ncbi:hypothetical protein SteCoe_34369 [Stentor coeruleus]|uniref:RGS domain-containing protein n=1 Tax=Stentor coeruleus TaxID=5963 RepID=A0A1R2AUN3_9CILI|nr:hypothetical protein SteCoe_34369 [Stentor coeruleus]
MHENYNVMMWCLIAVEIIVYVSVAIMLMKKRRNRLIKVRCIFLSQIGLWAGFSENIIVIIVLSNYLEDEKTSNLGLTLVTFAHFIVHYLFFLPFLLRSYRMYLIFKLDKDWDENDFTFMKKISRTKEIFLIKLLVVISLPIITLAICSFTIGGQVDYIIFDASNEKSSDSISQLTQSIGLLITFFEQFFCVLSINALRNINDDFFMKQELILVSLAWLITSPNNTFGFYSIFAYQILIRNTIVFTMSSVLPLIRSFMPQPLDIPVTEEILNFFPLMITSEFCMNAFELYIKDSKIQVDDKYGIYFLNMWLKCEYAKNATENLDSLDFSDEELQSLPKIQEQAFSILETIYYPHFKTSPQYNICLKEVNIQNLYLSRLHTISLGYLSNYRS